MLSAYRVFSRRFVKSFPAFSSDFETEAEFTVHALELDMPIGELPTRYVERPLMFFSIISAVMLLSGIGLGLPVVLDFFHTGLVPRLPTAVLATELETSKNSLFMCLIV